jgi:hypothetical protein
VTQELADGVTERMVESGDPYWLTLQDRIADPGQYIYAPHNGRIMRVLDAEPYREGTGWRCKVVTMVREPL